MKTNWHEIRNQLKIQLKTKAGFHTWNYTWKPVQDYIWEQTWEQAGGPLWVQAWWEPPNEN